MSAELTQVLTRLFRLMGDELESASVKKSNANDKPTRTCYHNMFVKDLIKNISDTEPKLTSPVEVTLPCSDRPENHNYVLLSTSLIDNRVTPLFCGTYSQCSERIMGNKNVALVDNDTWQDDQVRLQIVQTTNEIYTLNATVKYVVLVLDDNNIPISSNTFGNEEQAKMFASRYCKAKVVEL